MITDGRYSYRPVAYIDYKDGYAKLCVLIMFKTNEENPPPETWSKEWRSYCWQVSSQERACERLLEESGVVDLVVKTKADQRTVAKALACITQTMMEWRRRGILDELIF